MTASTFSNVFIVSPNVGKLLVKSHQASTSNVTSGKGKVKDLVRRE